METQSTTRILMSLSVYHSALMTILRAQDAKTARLVALAALQCTGEVRLEEPLVDGPLIEEGAHQLELFN